MSPEQRLEILYDRHDSPVAGHGGVARTHALVAKDFWWPGMRNYIKNYVQTCEVCQRNKDPCHRPIGLLMPLEIPVRPWGYLTTDFITKLPISDGFDAILVVVDRLTKMTHLSPCMETINAQQLADLFVTHVFCLHGLPDSIISDRGPQFSSRFWRVVLRRLGISRKLSSSFHPESDGQTERTNQTLEQYLRCFVDHQQSDWVHYLPLAEFALNNAPNASTKVTPFYALFGHHPRADNLVSPAEFTQHNVPAGEEFVTHISTTQAQVIQELSKAQAAYKAQSDRRRQPCTFRVGDKVWLLRRNIATHHPCSKLDHRRLGPFEIVEKVNDVAFRLVLPSHLRIHDVFHSSLLEPFHPNTLPGRHQPAPPP